MSSKWNNDIIMSTIKRSKISCITLLSYTPTKTRKRRICIRTNNILIWEELAFWLTKSSPPLALTHINATNRKTIMHKPTHHQPVRLYSHSSSAYVCTKKIRTIRGGILSTQNLFQCFCFKSQSINILFGQHASHG